MYVFEFQAVVSNVVFEYLPLEGVVVLMREMACYALVIRE